MAPIFDPKAELFLQNPYHYLNDLRNSAGIVPTANGKMVLDYNSVEKVLSDSHLSVRYIPNQISQTARVAIPNLEALGKFAIVFTDPPLHHRLRRLHMSAFSNKIIEGFIPQIEDDIQTILANIPLDKNIDVVENIADRVPKTVLSKLLGIDTQYHDVVAEKLLHTRTLLEPTKITPRTLKRLELEFSNCIDIFQTAINKRRKKPCSDIISLLTLAKIGDDYLSDKEIQISCALTYIAGHETTKSVIASGLKLFSEHSGQWQKLIEDESLLDSALDEILRFEPPLHFTTRMATKGFSINGVDICGGELILICIASANRDPTIFSEPNTFNISRNKKHHFSFGVGMHNCIGRHLAKIEARSVFKYFLKNGLHLRFSDKPEYKWIDAGPTTRSLEKFEACVFKCDQ